MTSENKDNAVEISIKDDNLNDILETFSAGFSEVANSLGSIGEMDQGKGNAFIGIAQGLWDVAAAIREHTKYMQSKD